MGICGEGGRKDVGIACGASNLDTTSVGFGAVLGELAKGIEKRGRNFCLLSLLSRVSIWMGSFSDRSSTVDVVEGGEGEVKGLSVRSGMDLVAIKRLQLVSALYLSCVCCQYGSCCCTADSDPGYVQ